MVVIHNMVEKIKHLSITCSVFTSCYGDALLVDVDIPRYIMYLPTFYFILMHAFFETIVYLDISRMLTIFLTTQEIVVVLDSGAI